MTGPAFRLWGQAPEHLAPELIAIAAADLRFFRRWPSRRYRLRLAGQAEVEEARACVGMISAVPQGARAYCAVRLIKPSQLQRAIGFARHCDEVDFSEGIAATAFAILLAQDVSTCPHPAALWCASPSSEVDGGEA